MIYRKIISICILIALFGIVPGAAKAKSGKAGPSVQKELTPSEKLDAGLQLWGWIGGWEADYTKDAYEGMVSYKGIPDLHLYAGYGYSDQVYYEREKFYVKGYYYFRPRSYAKVALSMKDYSYPDDSTLGRPNPDSTAYDRVPIIEFEVSHWFDRAVRGTVFAEHYRPEFFYDPDTKASNTKVGGDIYYIIGPGFLRAKVMFAMLRDPDPEKTEIKGRDNPNTPAGTAAETDIEYQTSFLLGGALEYVKDRWEAEIKVLPNRDLDSSYKYSILTYASYRFSDRLKGRLDYVYDKYSSESGFSGETAEVYMASGSYKLNERTDLGAGYKHIDLPDRTEDAGFLSLRVKTGVIF